MDAIDGVRELLPVWLRYGAGVGLVPLAFTAGFLATALGGRVALLGVRFVPGEHWTETARAGYPARFVAGMVPAIACGGSVATAATLGPLASLSPGALAVLMGAAGFCGAALAARPFAAPAFAKSALAQLRGAFFQLCAYGPLVACIMTVWWLLEPVLDLRNIAIAAIGVTSSVALTLFGVLPLLRLLGMLRPAAEKARRAVERAAERAGVAAPPTFQIDLPMANAFALPVSGWLVFTDSCVEQLGETQLQAVSAHELAHLAEPRSAALRRAAAMLALLPVAFSRVLEAAIGAPAMLGVIVLPYFVALSAVRRFSARMEASADHAAHGHEDAPGTYATALERLYQTNLSPAVLAGKSHSHPHLYDRMVAASAAPSWPRPAPPSGSRALSGTVAALAVLYVGLRGPQLVGELGSLGADREQAALLSIALSGGRPSDLFELGRSADKRDDLSAALTALELAVEQYPRQHDHRAYLAELLARSGDCAHAGEALAIATSDAQGDHRTECRWLERADTAIYDFCVEVSDEA